MAISIKDLKDTVDDLLDKNNSRMSTAEEFTRIVNISQDELFDDLVGTTNRRLNNQSLVGYGRTQNTDKRLEPFREEETINVVDGEATLPTECQKISAVVTSKQRPKALTRIDEDRVGMIFDNPLRSPNEYDIYYMEGRGYLQVFGLTDSIHLIYLRKPIRAVYAETEAPITVGNRTVTRNVYDSDNSTDLEWNESETLDLVNRILDKLTIPIKDNYTSQKVQINKSNE